MADPVASVEKIVKLGLAIKDAVDTVRHNEEECNEIRRRVLRFSTILSQLQQRGMMSDSPAMSGALEDLEETLERALELVTACQERSTIRRLVTAGDLSRQLRWVKDDILNKVMLASFAINAQTIVLLNTQAGGYPPPRQPEDTGVLEILHNIHSNDDARSELNGNANEILTGSEAPFAPSVALRNFSLSELKAAINGKNIIGEGSSCEVYKGVLHDGNVVAIKKLKSGSYRPLNWADFYHQLLLASKLQHKNVVKVLGYGHEVESSSMMPLLKRKSGRAKEREYFWVEEYVANGSLDMIIHESQLDWSFLFRIIEGVAQGVCYLHEQLVVHRDVKPHNILLDSDMNPKIIDFELSKVFDLDDEKFPQTGIVGTFGYIAPEYARFGDLSMKNDVYAFGTTLLETVSGMCRSKPPREHPLYKWVWEAWEAGRMEDVFDPSLFDRSQLMEIKRYVQVGLLCVEDDRARRPTMADVLQMLHGLKELPTPKKPAYISLGTPGPDSPSASDEAPLPDSPSAWSDGSISPR